MIHAALQGLPKGRICNNMRHDFADQTNRKALSLSGKAQLAGPEVFACEPDQLYDADAGNNAGNCEHDIFSEYADDRKHDKGEHRDPNEFENETPCFPHH